MLAARSKPPLLSQQYCTAAQQHHPEGSQNTHRAVRIRASTAGVAQDATVHCQDVACLHRSEAGAHMASQSRPRHVGPRQHMEHMEQAGQLHVTGIKQLLSMDCLFGYKIVHGPALLCLDRCESRSQQLSRGRCQRCSLTVRKVTIPALISVEKVLPLCLSSK